MQYCFQFVLISGVAGFLLQAASLPEPQTPRAIKTIVRADATGRLVRSVVVSPRVVHENVIAPKPVATELPEPEHAAPTGPPSTFREAVDWIAQKHSLPPQLVHSVISVESGYNPNAISPKGAQGLMQLIPATAHRFGVNNVFNPVENVEGGAKYLQYLLELYKGDFRLALAAYNAGEGAVNKYRGIPPYPETVNYINQVGRRLVEAQQQKKKVEVKPEPAKPVEPAIHQIIGPDGKVRYVTKQ
jgi:soluble lytic murein transglycosylase-like protein